MKKIPIYKHTFSRDFTLVNMEVWWRGEVLNKKIWTKESQPFLPYIVFEKTDEVVNCFYDPRGIEWMKNSLLEKVSKDKNFLTYLEKNLLENISRVSAVYNKKTELNHKELCQYLHDYENGYVWFEAAWWLWDLNEKELVGALIPDSFRKLREDTQDYVPKSESLIRKSLAKIYSEFEDFIEVISISEIQSNKIPSTSELAERKRGYYFTDNKIFTGLSRMDIEKKFSIRFEKIEINDTKDLVGESAYRGKVIGKVRIILSVKNLNKIKTGEVLVSAMTLPDFMPAIKKSIALITDEGGLLSHAAIVARELKKPCVVGTKIATKVLKDGDLVEVDAEKGVVRIINKI